ncbi:MAG: Microbial collagenase [Chloroflexi bacterium]|nr:Microbial collagenase [Chloroflexota bacterium]
MFYTPEATFTFNPPVPLVGQEVSFNAGQSYDADGNIRQYMWRFGDESVVIADHPVVEHTYPEAGDYTVSLTVVDNDGLTSSISRSPQAVPPPAVVIGRAHLQGRTEHSGERLSSTATQPPPTPTAASSFTYRREPTPSSLECLTIFPLPNWMLSWREGLQKTLQTVNETKARFV